MPFKNSPRAPQHRVPRSDPADRLLPRCEPPCTPQRHSRHIVCRSTQHCEDVGPNPSQRFGGIHRTFVGQERKKQCSSGHAIRRFLFHHIQPFYNELSLRRATSYGSPSIHPVTRGPGLVRTIRKGSQAVGEHPVYRMRSRCRQERNVVPQIRGSEHVHTAGAKYAVDFPQVTNRCDHVLDHVVRHACVEPSARKWIRISLDDCRANECIVREDFLARVDSMQLTKSR